MKKISLLMAILGIGFIMNVAEIEAAPNKANIGQQSSLALLWMQDGAEYKSLVHQAFNIAEKRVREDKMIKKVFVRVDEVLLDNTPYFAWLLKSNEKDTIENRNRWYSSLDAEAVDGAVEFINYLNKNNVEVKLITSRDRNVYDVTIRNMNKAGFKALTLNNLISESDFDSYVKNGGKYTAIVTNDLNDFSSKIDGKNYRERKAFADNQKNDFGKKWVIIPNVLYGDFETSLSKGYDNLDNNKKANVKIETLNEWNGTREFDRNIFNF
ncbi:HAD family acid phosphatase [Haliovirga abyssi]|uniref:Acid phosphatase n=1 Tax=Haliovirga abyssi TaxID=2996794 RepID=A0AAU9DDF8_9FUSO|nr:HAD family acid phosphatase [Haliovirga abyssi]BDU51385.1 hypothetical protein HLVA_19540 [Haliovirga abyssi]